MRDRKVQTVKCSYLHDTQEKEETQSEIDDTLKAVNADAVSQKIETPKHYTKNSVETIDKLDMLLEYLKDKITPQEAAYIFNFGKYFDRAGSKDDIEKDLKKCADYIYRFKHGIFLNQEERK